MKNLQYFPFERNRYYYGKLLTEQDFVSEQRYMNDKRRLLNRFLHGVGIVAGFQVVKMDEKSLSVEAGFALDGAGREIVAERPFSVRLEQMDGFEALAEQGSRDFLYLCIGYDETETMPSHNITSHSSLKEESLEHDKYREGCRLYLTDRPLENRDTTVEAFFRQRTILYEDDGICVTQETPRFVAGGENFLVALIVENKKGIHECSICLEEVLECAAFEEKNRFWVDIKELFDSRKGEQRFEFLLKAYPVDMGEVRFSLRPGDGKIDAGGRLCLIDQEIQLRIPVVNQKRADRIREQYFKEAMNSVLQNVYPSGIYLAKIFLIQTGRVYLIDRVEPVPFGQYVYGPQLMMGLLEVLTEQMEKKPKESEPPKTVFFQEEPEALEDFAQGVAEIQLGIGGRRGQKFFSHEIVHGLGLGKVAISLALESDQQILWGSPEIFDDISPKAELAAKADQTRGSFYIGIRLLEATGMQSVRIHWTARKGREEMGAAEEMSLGIRPDKLEMKVRETYYLQAETRGLSGMTIVWEVKTPDGGRISRDGMYQAPGHAGVFEVQARCQERPKLRASLYIIVRE